VKGRDSDAVRDYVRRKYVEPARRRGESVVRILAGEVHRDLRLTNRVRLVCSALASRAFLEGNGLLLERREGPPSGISPTTVFTYSFKQRAEHRSGQAHSPFYALRGIGKNVFQSFGGGEAFIRRERRQFSGASARNSPDQE
jgi:hypothetical protein